MTCVDLVPPEYQERLIALIVAKGNAIDALHLRRHYRWVDLWEMWGAQKALNFEERKSNEEAAARAKAAAKR